MSARCSLAPLPLYKGNPLPVSLAPVSKSMISRSLMSSQCGLALVGKSGFFPPSRTTSLSSALVPDFTLAAGRLGNCSNNSCRPSSSCCTSCSSLAISCLLSAMVVFCVSASSFLPSFINWPISLLAAFCLAFSSSMANNAFLRASSSSTSSSTKPTCRKLRNSRRSFTKSVFSRSILISSMCINFCGAQIY